MEFRLWLGWLANIDSFDFCVVGVLKGVLGKGELVENNAFDCCGVLECRGLIDCCGKHNFCVKSDFCGDKSNG